MYLDGQAGHNNTLGELGVMKNTKRVIVSFLAAIVLTIMSPLLISADYYGFPQVYIRLGIPFAYIEQEIWPGLSGGEYPIQLTLLSPWEFPTRILWANFLLSVIVFGILTYSIFYFGEITVKKIKAVNNQ